MISKPKFAQRLGALLVVLASLATVPCVAAQSAAAAVPYDQAASLESVNFPGRYVRHRYFLGELTPLATDLDRSDATFIMRRGLTGAAGSVSFESVNFPGHYLRHQYFRIKLAASDGTALFKQDATFIAHELSRTDEWKFESVNFPGHFIRHQNFELWLGRDDGSALFDRDSTWHRTPPATAGGCPGADLPITQDTVPVAEAAITCLTNQERKKAGLAPLTINATLQGVARGHSLDMVQRRYFAHNTPEGRTPCQRITGAGYPAGWCGENIAWALPATANRFMYDPQSGWMTHPGPDGTLATNTHRQNILRPQFKEIGVGVAVGNPQGGPGSAGATATEDFGGPA